MVHTVFTVVAPVAPSRVGHVRFALSPGFGSTNLPVRVTVDTLPTLHFASMAVFDSQKLPDGTESMAYLILQCCIDGPIPDFFKALLFLDKKQGGPLADVFAMCHNPGKLPLLEYLDEHKRCPDLCQIGVPGMRLSHILAGQRLRGRLDEELDKMVADGSGSDDPATIFPRLRDALKVPAMADLHCHLMESGWVEDPTKLWRSRLRHWSWLALFVAAVIVLILGPILAAWWRWNFGAAVGVAIAEFVIAWRVRKWYLGSNSSPIELDGDHLATLKDLEDRRVQNHMCTFTVMQDSALRRGANRIALGVFELFYRTVFTDVTPGRLDGLPTIHFGHWTQVPLLDASGKPTRHRALMFLSNYDGSWEAYLDDFIALLASGVATIWASCVGFRWPMHGPTFKAYARNGMTRWSNWYTGEPDVTVLNIHNNDQIRKGLLKPPETPEAARLWLSRFGSLKNGHEFIPEANGQLQVGDVQGIVLSGYARLHYSLHVPLRIDNAAAAGEWLQKLVPHVTDGRHLPDRSRSRPPAVNVAFTHRGLLKLGLPPATCEKFPVVFQEGMAPQRQSHRSRALGDNGDSHPYHWQWGGELNNAGVDVLLLLYAESDAELKILIKERVVPFEKRCGVVVGTPIEGKWMESGAKEPLSKLPLEHFGFVDGVSQPQIEGTWHGGKARTPSGNDVIKPGEFVLGYPDEAGLLAAGIPLDQDDDPAAVLPQLNGSAAMRDFGRNGSFLVARQLHQDVARFRSETSTWGGAHGPHGLAARMVGRTQDGLPLAASASPDSANDFNYAGDPHGFKCPLGAHIRRANPRGSLGDDFDASLLGTRRRRMLRRGRTYGDPLPSADADDGASRGVMFICLNADIERQFEFVQQNWINNPVFAGVHSERDPGVGERRSDEVGLTVQTEHVRERVLNLSRFVTVKGGDYFFLPGIRALRYLAARPPQAQAAGAPLPVPAVAWRQTVPVPAPKSWATALVQQVAGRLPGLSRLVALRFQILTAAVLLLFGVLGAGPNNRLGPSLFLAAHWGGVVVVALLASLAASIVMLTTRIPLMYGRRNGLGPGRWLGPIRWPAVLLFQVLALPVVLATLHWTAIDATWLPGERTNTWAYVKEIGRLALPALGGFVLAGLLLAFSARIGARGRVARLKLRVTQWALARVPRAIGTGYVDYENRRLLPGHGRLLAMAAVLAVLYVTGAIVLSPLWAWSRTLAEQVPSIAYLLLPVMAAAIVAPAAAFFLDRYRVPTLIVAVAVVLFLFGVAPSDHYFRVGSRLAPGATPQQALVTAKAQPSASDRVVLVLGEGYGLVSSAWTGRVLAELAHDSTSGRRFTGGIRLVSTSSGASLGALYFVDGYTPTGFDVSRLPSIRERAGLPSSGEGGWGFAYPDTLRVVLPFVVPQFVDRGWAMERAWQGRLPGPTAKVSRWRADTKAGWRPATAFATSLVETGEPALITSYRDDAGPSPTGGYDVPMVTAARLSATFPFISPPARPDVPDGGPPRPHVMDAGLTDNLGWLAARQWLEAVRSMISTDRILLLDIRSVPPVNRTTPAGVESWVEEITSPLQALLNARGWETARVNREIDEFVRTWPGAHPIAHVTFRLADPTVPLSWNLGRADAARLDAAWARNHANAVAVCRFIAEDASSCR